MTKDDIPVKKGKEQEPKVPARRFEDDFDMMLGGLLRGFDDMFSHPFSFGDMPGMAAFSRALPAFQGQYGVDVKDHGEEIIVVADMPGMEKGKVGIEVVNPRVLRIFAEREDQEEETGEGFYRRERMFGTVDRMVPLPAEVKPDDATATLNNGVLEIRLKKIEKEPKKRISIT